MAKRTRYYAAAATGVASFFVAYGVASAACVSPASGASQASIDRLMASPAALLERFPEGQGALVSEVRNYVATNFSTLGPIAGLIPSANADQRRSIGAGLGQAAAMCARSEPETARRIQEAILAADSREVSLAFQGVVGDRPTAAVGPGGSGANSGGGLGGGGLTSLAGVGGGSGATYSYNTPAVTNTGYTFGTGGGSSVSPTSGSGATYTIGTGSGTSGTSGSGSSGSPSIIVVSNNTNNNVNNVSSSSSSSATANSFGIVSPH